MEVLFYADLSLEMFNGGFNDGAVAFRCNCR